MYRVIDLFAGAGGLSLGFKQTGKFKFVAAAEIMENARLTYMHNIPEDDSRDKFEFITDIRNCDFNQLKEKIGNIDIVIGGPPCQGFSNANRQKNHIVSMNNAMVKDYFRAIQELSPIAFVMENVSMLVSEKHRFYDSESDHALIEKLNQSNVDEPDKLIVMRDDTIVISNRVFDDFDLVDIASNDELRRQLTLPDQLYHLIRVLNKNKNSKRLDNYLANHTKSIRHFISQYCANPAQSNNQQVIYNWLNEIDQNLDKTKIADLIELTDLVELQKVFVSINEILDNRLIGKYSIRDNSLIFHTHSYSVIDYVNAILGDKYVQHGATLCAEWFGVPQERRRHIVIGIRKDVLGDKDFKMPIAPEKYETITVGDAILDLSVYKAATTSDCDRIEYINQPDISDYARKMREGSTGVKNHFATKTSKKAQERFDKIEIGKNFHSLPVEDKDTYTNPERTQNTIYLKLDPTKPSGTVVNVRKSMWIHPELSRAITVREAARLQSFPDKFEFIGTKDSQYQQVGNAVPPLLANGIAAHLLKILEK